MPAEHAREASSEGRWAAAQAAVRQAHLRMQLEQYAAALTNVHQLPCDPSLGQQQPPHSSTENEVDDGKAGRHCESQGIS